MKKIQRKALLYKTEVEYGDYTINHVLGCMHGCKYPCYAFNMAKRFGNIKSYEEWIKPSLVENSLEILEREIPKYKSKIKTVQLSFTTDPFMKDYPEVGDMSLKIINRLNQDDIKCVILTKSILPSDLVETKKINEYGITLVSLDETFRKEYEPYSSNYKERITSLKQLHDNGHMTWVSIEPYPTPNICEQNLLTILKKVDFVDYIVFGRLNYNKKVTAYKDYKKFYNECVEIVKKFCREKKIRLHIKEGTFTEF